MTSDDVEQQLLEYITAATRVRPILSQLHGLDLRAIDIQEALCSVLGIAGTNSMDLLNQKLTEDSIIRLLRNFDFRRYHPEVIGGFVLDDGIVPEGTRRLLSEQTVKVRGEVWRVYKSDADPWPSNPHAHNYETGTKLDLGTGDLYDINRRWVGNIGKKKLEAVRAKLVNIELPTLSK